MSTRVWVEMVFDCDPMSAIKQVMASKQSGQLVLNVSQGTVCAVVWREKKSIVEVLPKTTEERILREHT